MNTVWNTTRLHEALNPPADSRVQAIIDTAALARNYRRLTAGVQTVSPHTRSIAVVKADAYGHGIRPVVTTLVRAGCTAFAVACLEEAIALRALLNEIIPTGEPPFILVLGYIRPEDVAALAAHHITATLVSAIHAEALAESARRAGVTVSVHAALDTGMNRIGYPAHTDDEIRATTAALITLKTAFSELSLDGMFTHFARSDEDIEVEYHAEKSLTITQLQRYRQVLEALTAAGARPAMCHICNSAAAVRFPSIWPADCLDAVRLGIDLYGYGVPFPDEGDTGYLEPVMHLETRVSHVHSLLPGEAVGYGGTFSSDTPRLLATLPIGYADGWIRALTGATVTLHTPAGDLPAPIVGRICMDQCMVDITDLPNPARESVGAGMRVTLFGAHHDELEALAAQAGTITYELLCLVTARVVRIWA